jgi:hypothetical protein
MDLKEFTEYNFINNLKKPSDYQYQLDTIKQKLLPLMDEFKKYYVFFNKSPEYPEYQPTFENIKNNIQLLNSELLSIGNNIKHDTEQINSELLNLNTKISEEKNKNGIFKKILQNMNNKYNASDEMISDYQELYNLYYLRNFSLFIGIIFSSYVIYKVYKPNIIKN